MTLTQIMAFAFLLTGFSKDITPTSPTETPMIKDIRERSEEAAKAIHAVFTEGYVLEPGKPAIKVKPLFDVTETFTLDQAIEASEKLALRVAWHESAFTPKAHKTTGGDDDCGLMQTKTRYISMVAPGKTCTDVKKDILLGAFVGIQVLHLHRDMCVEKVTPKYYEKVFNAQYWLGAYATGWCGKAPMTSKSLCSSNKTTFNVCGLK